LKRLTGKPLVLDFRDPWIANPIFLLKTPFIRSLESRMERKVVKMTDHIIANTHELKQDFLQRYPMLSADKVSVIPNGFEEYTRSQEHRNTALTLTYAGALHFRNPRFLFQAAINLIEKKQIPQNELQIVFLGKISTQQDPLLEEVLRHPLLQNVVEVLPRLPYQEAAQYQSRSDVLFLIQTDYPLQIPRKLYEYIAFKKPILGITNTPGATARVIRENDLGIVAENRTEELEVVLKDFYEKWKRGFLSVESMSRHDESSKRGVTTPQEKSSLSHQYQNKSDKFINKNLTIELLKIFQNFSHPEGDNETI
jgi:hypothetical protein